MSDSMPWRDRKYLDSWHHVLVNVHTRVVHKFDDYYMHGEGLVPYTACNRAAGYRGHSIQPFLIDILDDRKVRPCERCWRAALGGTDE